MLDYIRILHYSKGLKMSGRDIAKVLGISKSGVNDFLKAFGKCEALNYPLPPGTTNMAVYDAVYGARPGKQADATIRMPDFEDVAKKLRQANMTLQYLWNAYRWKCEAGGEPAYSYRQFCRLYSEWCSNAGQSFHFTAAPGESMEVDFAGTTFRVTDPYTGDVQEVVVFVAALPYSQAIYAEGMTNLSEAHWINVNNNALQYFGGVPALVIPDNCKQAVIANRDWVEPELNKAYAEWAEWNKTYILPAKVRRPTYKASVECSVGILERGIFHDLAAVPFFSLEHFNETLRGKVQEVNDRPFAKKKLSRSQLPEEERKALMPLPDSCYEYAESRTAKVGSTGHVHFSGAYYSVDYHYANRTVTVRATSTRVRIYALNGEQLADWPRAQHRGEYKTNPDHMPAWYRDMKGADVVQFISKAAQIGPNTSQFIRQLLESCEVPVQGFRRCRAILSFAGTYGKEVLEESCAQALHSGRVNYTFLKTTIAAVADNRRSEEDAAATDALNEAVYEAPASTRKLETLLSRSAELAAAAKKEGDEA